MEAIKTKCAPISRKVVVVVETAAVMTLMATMTAMRVSAGRLRRLGEADAILAKVEYRIVAANEYRG